MLQQLLQFCIYGKNTAAQTGLKVCQGTGLHRSPSVSWSAHEEQHLQQRARGKHLLSLRVKVCSEQRVKLQLWEIQNAFSSVCVLFFSPLSYSRTIVTKSDSDCSSMVTRPGSLTTGRSGEILPLFVHDQFVGGLCKSYSETFPSEFACMRLFKYSHLYTCVSTTAGPPVDYIGFWFHWCLHDLQFNRSDPKIYFTCLFTWNNHDIRWGICSWSVSGFGSVCAWVSFCLQTQQKVWSFIRIYSK